jgi:benzoate membrane transport protein
VSALADAVEPVQRGRAQGASAPPGASAARGVDAAAVSAGIAAFLFFALGPLPLQVVVARDLGLSAAQSSSWIFVVWASGAAVSIALCLAYRQPIVVTWSVLGLVYLGTLGDAYSFPELAGANLVAGFVILALALLGAGERLMRLVPLPIVLGMFAGSVLVYVRGTVSATVEDGLVAGAAVAGYFAGRLLGLRVVPPVGVAAVAGAVAIGLAGRAPGLDPAWSLPSLEVPRIAFSPEAILAVSPPLVVLALLLGNIQGLGFLRAEGYRVPVNAVSVAVGLASVVNVALGGHQASVGRNAVAICAGSEAGPRERRYRAGVVASVLALAIAVGATTILSVVTALPASYVAALAGLSVLATFENALGKALGSELRFGAVVAFLVAATPFATGGVGSSTWALVAGLAASFACERGELVRLWRAGSAAPGGAA